VFIFSKHTHSVVRFLDKAEMSGLVTFKSTSLVATRKKTGMSYPVPVFTKFLFRIRIKLKFKQYLQTHYN